MENNRTYISLVMALIFGACVSENRNTDQSSNAEMNQESSHPKGQASVVDDESAKNILQVAMGSEDHTTLVAAIQAADVEKVLVNPGPFTVFAPTNEAFDNLPEGTVETLLKPENKEKLAFVIYNHAAPGVYKGEALRNGMTIYMATGNYLKVERKGDDVFVDGAKILGTVGASNGVIHVVDKVLVPADK